MPTRKELLEALTDNVEGLSGEILDSTDTLSDSTDRMVEATDRMTENVEYYVNGVRVSLDDAAGRHGKSIEKAGGDILVGLIGGAAVLAGGLAIGGLIKVAMQRSKEACQRIQIIDSIISLHDTHGAMDYDFVVARSYAVDTTSEERQTMINGLMYEGIIIETQIDGQMKLIVDEDSDALDAHWEWLEELAESAEANE